MWPLCHVAHVRPVFRESDWEQYREVNQRFADAVVAEARSEDPVVLVQDYHFALLPADDRARSCRAPPSSRSGTSPGRTPSRSASARGGARSCEGMLGSTILGFHTRFHCKNFIETVDRFLEARIEHEHSTISFQGDGDLDRELSDLDRMADAGRAGVMAAGAPSAGAACSSAWTCRPTPAWRVGVDRFDYTKGILERLHAVERLLEKHPEWLGKLRVRAGGRADAQLRSRSTAASRSASQRVTERINQRFGTAGYQPVHLLAEHHEHEARQRAVPRRRHLRGDQPARRHEPGLQGVRRRARRRAGRADPEPLRRRRARADRGADRQPVPRRGVAPMRCTAPPRCRRPSSASAWRACA